MMKRGKYAGLQHAMIDKLRPFSVTVTANSLDEITLEIVIDKVRRAAVIDGDDVGAGEDANPFSMESYLSALAEEMAATADMFGGDEPDTASGSTSLDFEQTLRDLRSDNGNLNWGLFELA